MGVWGQLCREMGVRCPGRSNKSSQLPSPSGPWSCEDRPHLSHPQPTVLSGEWGTLPKLHSNELAISWNILASSRPLFVAPRLALGVFSSMLCLQEGGQRAVSTAKKGLLYQCPSPFSWQVTFRFRGQSQGYPFVEEVSGEWDFLGSEFG